MRIAKPLQRLLRSRAPCPIAIEPFHETLERLEVVGWTLTKTVIEGVLSERALRPIESGEHIVQIQILPGAIVQFVARAGFTGPPGTVRFGDGVEAYWICQRSEETSFRPASYASRL